jgi:hypothetical protein
VLAVLWLVHFRLLRGDAGRVRGQVRRLEGADRVPRPKHGADEERGEEGDVEENAQHLPSTVGSKEPSPVTRKG